MNNANDDARTQRLLVDKSVDDDFVREFLASDVRTSEAGPLAPDHGTSHTFLGLYSIF